MEPGRAPRDRAPSRPDPGSVGGGLPPEATPAPRADPPTVVTVVELVPVVVGAVHVVAAVGWLGALLVGLDPQRGARVVPTSLRSLAESVRLRPSLPVAILALSGLGLTAIELTEGAGGRADRDLVPDPSTLWVALVAAKAALLAGVVGVGAVSGPVAPVGAASDGAGPPGSGPASGAATADRATSVTAGLVGAALLLGVAADVVGVGAGV